jgi:ATP-dependent RNA helicase DDX52/ROK1
MEAFHLLSRGGVNFDKRRFKKDVELFTGVRLVCYKCSICSE